MLDDGEVLVWAEKPTFVRVLTSSVRDFALHPLHFVPALLLCALLIARQAGVAIPIAGDTFWIPLAIVAAVVGPLLIDLVVAIVAGPFFAPSAYGATHAYFLIARGLILRRLKRMPVSLVKDVTLAPWGGRDVPVFVMHEGHKQDFSLLHVTNPAATHAAIASLIGRGEQP